MALRRARPFRWEPSGVTDSLDATTTFKGSMQSLSNLVPSPTDHDAFVCRAASIQQTVFGGFTTPTGVTALFVLGTKVYGMVSSADFAGKDEPFVFDINTGLFVTVTGVTSALLPATQSTSGDWQPPKMDMVAKRIYVTHPGFAGGGGPFFGFFDISGFTSNTITGNTHTSTTVDTLSSNPIAAGWQVGMLVSSSAGDIPANTYIKALTATSITLSAAATGTNAGVTLTVTGGTAGSPLWGAGNTNNFPLPSVPNSVAQYNGRAWWACGNSLIFSDALNGTQVSNATAPQVLTLGDTTNVTALAGLGLFSSTIGGVVQSLIAFKGDAIMFQIQGDQATSNLSLNTLNVSVGTNAPNTICNTPLGLAFIAPDGLRIIGLDATVSDPIGAHGSGICAPFIFANNPSRMAAAFNQNTYRVTVQNSQAPSQPVQDWWLDFALKKWTGPHTFGANFIASYQAPSGALSGHGFVLAPNAAPASLFTSSVSPTSADTYVENGTQMTFNYATSLLPDTGEMEQNRVVDTTLMISLPLGYSVTVTAQDEQLSVLNTVTLSGSFGTAAIWGSFNWGAALWGATGYYRQYWVQWTTALIFKQMSVSVVGNSSGQVQIGHLNLRYQILGYLTARLP